MLEEALREHYDEEMVANLATIAHDFIAAFKKEDSEKNEFLKEFQSWYVDEHVVSALKMPYKTETRNRITGQVWMALLSSKIYNPETAKRVGDRAELPIIGEVDKKYDGFRLQAAIGVVANGMQLADQGPKIQEYGEIFLRDDVYETMQLFDNEYSAFAAAYSIDLGVSKRIALGDILGSLQTNRDLINNAASHDVVQCIGLSYHVINNLESAE